jgi:hypothetical protein
MTGSGGIMTTLFTARPWTSDRHKYVVLPCEEKVEGAQSASTSSRSHTQSKTKGNKIWPIMLSAVAIVLTALIASTYEAPWKPSSFDRIG